MNPLWKEMRDLVIQDMHRIEILNSIFPHFSPDSGPAPLPGKDRGWQNEEPGFDRASKTRIMCPPVSTGF